MAYTSYEELVRREHEHAQKTRENFDKSKQGQMVQRGAGSGGVYRSADATGADFQQLSDPMAQLAMRLGQIRGVYGLSRSGSGGLVQSNAFGENLERLQTEPLEDMLEAQRRKQELEEKLLLQQIQASSRKPAARSSMGGMSMGNGMGGGASSRGNEWHNIDPYAELREDSIKAAQRILKQKKPHLLSSLED